MQTYHLISAPKEAKKSNKIARVGSDGELYYPTFGELKPRVLKERLSFAGGYKMNQSNVHKVKSTQNIQNDEEKQLDQTDDLITKEMILEELDLQADESDKLADNTELTRSYINKATVDDINKHIGKLQLQKNNLERRKELITTGEIKSDETLEQKSQKIKASLENEEGANVLHADPNRIQIQRHQTGQLGGLGEITLKEIQELRKQNQDKVSELEERYIKAK